VLKVTPNPATAGLNVPPAFSPTDHLSGGSFRRTGRRRIAVNQS